MPSTLRDAALWSHPRVVVAGLAVAGVMAGLVGVTESLLFAEASPLKYAITVTMPLLVLVLVSTREWQLLLAAGAVFVAPFAFVATVFDVQLSPLAVVLAVAVLTTRFGTPAGRRPLSGMALAVVLALALLATPILRGNDPARYVELLATAAAMGYVVARTATTPRRRKLMVWAFVASVTVQAALADWEFVTGHRLNLYGSSNGELFGPDYFFSYGDIQRAAAAMSDPISLGNVLALGLPLLVTAGAQARGRLERLILAGAGVVVVLGLVAALSRTSWVAAAAGAALALAMLPGRARVRVALGGAAVLGVGATLALGIGGSAVVERFTSISDPTGNHVLTATGDRVRAALQHQALVVGDHHPFSGIGMGDLEAVLIAKVHDAAPGTHAHSTYLQLYAEAGLLGLAALALVLLAAVVTLLVRRRVDRPLTAGAAGAIMVMLICFTTDYTVRNPSVIAMEAVVLGLVAATRPGAPTVPDRQVDGAIVPERSLVGAGT